MYCLKFHFPLRAASGPLASVCEEKVSVCLFMCLFFIADQTAGRIGTNLIYSESSGSAGRNREKKISKFPFLMELLAVKRVRGWLRGGGVPKFKKFFSVKKTHVDGQTRQRRVFPLVCVYVCIYIYIYTGNDIKKARTLGSQMHLVPHSPPREHTNQS